MRWLLAGALAVAVFGCGESTLGPTSTLDGVWRGTSPGFELTLSLSQKDSIVTGTAILNGISGYGQFRVDGTLLSHAVALVVSAQGFTPMHYDGTLSSTEAVINGRLDGSGFNKLEMAFKKR